MSAHDAELAALAAEHDRSDLAGVIARLPGQVEHAVADASVPAIGGGPFDRVVVAGMGGSALPVDVLRGAFPGRVRVPLTVCRHYAHDERVDERTLAIASSFSGNTEETIAAIESLSERGARVAVVCAGGQLAERARAEGWPAVRVPKEREPADFQPRCATGYVVTYLARLLASAGCMDDVRGELGRLPVFLRALDVRTEAVATARWLGDRIAVLYTDERHLASVARVTKIKLNEHAKRAAFASALPEANHNEMIGFLAPVGRFALLYLRDPASHERVDRRFDVMARVLADAGARHLAFRTWDMPGESALEKTFAALAFGDWLAWARAMLDGVDPTPVDLVERFKRELDRA